MFPIATANLPSECDIYRQSHIFNTAQADVEASSFIVQIIEKKLNRVQVNYSLLQNAR